MATLTVNLPLSDDDRAVLEHYLGGTPPTEAAAAPETPAKASKAPKSTPPAVEAEAPAETPATSVTEPADDEDLIGSEGPTLEEVVKRAQDLVADGGTAKVKAALAVVGVKRVSQLAGDQVAAFAAELDKG